MDANDEMLCFDMFLCLGDACLQKAKRLCAVQNAEKMKNGKS